MCPTLSGNLRLVQEFLGHHDPKSTHETAPALAEAETRAVVVVRMA